MTAVDFRRVDHIWRQIIAAGPRAPFADVTRGLFDVIERELAGTVDSCERHAFEIIDWSGAAGTATIDGAVFAALPAIQSRAAEDVRGTLALAGRQVIWGMRNWPRYAVVDAARTPLAVILVRPNGEPIPEPLLPGSLDVPHVIVGADAAAPLEQALADGTPVALSCPATPRPRRRAENLVAHVSGDDALPRVLLSAHLDSVYTTAGAYDNATGAAALVGLADVVASLPRRGPVTLVWFNAEEWSMAGSAAFAAERAEHYDLVINLDGFGRTELLELWAGPEWFELWFSGLLADAGRALGWTRPERHMISFTPPPGGSDHDVFYRAGVPVAMLTHDDQAIIHTPADDVPHELMRAHLEQGVALLERALPRVMTEFTAVRAAYERSRGRDVGVAFSLATGRRVANLTDIADVATPAPTDDKEQR